VADSLNITNLSEPVASVLASDVEYRINQVVDVRLLSFLTSTCRLNSRQEASRFMRHGKRTILTTSDIDQALRVLNIEPLYGHLPSNPPAFRRTLPFPQSPVGPVYFVEDEEIDFDRVFREEKLTLPKSVTWTAHWLAVEGVQPLIPENPPAIPRETEPEAPKAMERLSNVFPPTPPSSNQLPSNQTAKKQQPQQQLVKQVLSRELQLYYARLTSSLFPATGDEAKVTAALTSLRHDAGLQALLPYLIRWVDACIKGALKDGAQGEEEGKTLEVSFNIISAILENNTLFVEPYVSVPYVFVTRVDCSRHCPASSNYTPNFINLASFRAPSYSCHTHSNFRFANAFPSPNSTLNDLSFSLSTYHENASFCTNLRWKKQRDARRCYKRVSKCRERGDQEGFGRRWWCQSCGQRMRIGRVRPISQSRHGELLQACPCFFSDFLCILGCVYGVRGSF
jgi:hypothetical protein